MKFFIVLLAILKYAFLVLLFLILLVLVLALILMISPIRYTAVVNYKGNNLYYNVDVTYLGKIIGFKLKGVKSKFNAYVRLLHKKVYIKSDDRQKSKKQAEKKTKSTSSSKSKKSSKTENVDEQINKSDKTDKTFKAKKNTESNIPLNVAQKITPTTTLEEAMGTSDTPILHNSKVDVKDNINISSDYEEKKPLENNAANTKTSFSESQKDTNATSDSSGQNDTDEDATDDADAKDLSFIGKIKKFLNNINFYIESYKTYPYRDKLFIKLKKIFTNLKDALFPKVFDCSGEIYINDPAITGQILGFLYMLHGLNKTFNVSVDADFETEKNNFTTLISGRIIIIKLVYPVLSFVWLGLKAEARRRNISRIKLIKILINNE